MNYIGQVVGILAIMVSVFIYIQPSRYRMILLKLFTDFLWMAHHVLIFSYPAAATTGIAILREIIFFQQRKNIPKKLVLVVFFVLFTAAAVLTWKDGFSVLPAMSSVLATVAFGSNRVKFIRRCGYVSSVCMLVYGLHYFSIPTIINEVLVESSIIISLCKKKEVKG